MYGLTFGAGKFPPFVYTLKIREEYSIMKIIHENYINGNFGGCAMLAAVKGYYDGNQIVMNEDDRKNLRVGDEVIITILDKISKQKVETRAEKRRRLIESDAFVIPTGRTTEEIDGYIRELRDNDRF